MENTRVIKFRAWNIQQKKFIKIAQLDFQSGIPMVWVNGSHPHCYTTQYPADENVLQQFTGLNDMNGNPIYEGDIIQQHPISKYRSWEVKYNVSDGFNLSESADYEIVGNIFEHTNIKL